MINTKIILLKLSKNINNFKIYLENNGTTKYNEIVNNKKQKKNNNNKHNKGEEWLNEQ